MQLQSSVRGRNRAATVPLSLPCATSIICSRNSPQTHDQRFSAVSHSAVASIRRFQEALAYGILIRKDREGSALRLERPELATGQFDASRMSLSLADVLVGRAGGGGLVQ